MLNVRLFTRKIQWLCLAIVFSLSYSANGQQGYYWTFASSSVDGNGNKFFSSSPALTGSTSNYALTVMGMGTFTTGISDNPGVGTSCTSVIPIATYPNYTGLEFLNGSPQLISTAYTIEMTINQGASGDYKRLISFYDLGGETAENDRGIYVTPEGYIQFRAATPATITASPLSANTWYHLAFTRTSTGLIKYYVNGTYVGQFTDSFNDFIPHPGDYSYNIITFLKDNEGEDVNGKLARIGIYDAVLEQSAIAINRDKACEAIPEEVWKTSGNFGTNETHFIGTKNNQPLIFKTNNQPAITIAASGNVGIGASAPLNKLHAELNGTSTNTIGYPLRISHTTSNTATTNFGVGQEFELENAAGTNKVTSSISSLFTAATDATESADIVFSSIAAGTLAERARIKAGGQLFIDNSASGHQIGKVVINYNGSNNPSISGVGGTIYSGSHILLSGGGEKSIGASTTQTGNLAFVHNRTAQGMVWKTAPVTMGTLVEQMRLTSTGNFGIGTTNPTARLHTSGSVRFEGVINNNALTQILATDASGNISWREVSTIGASGAVWTLGGNTGINSATNFIGTIDAQSLSFRTNNLERILISADGNVGIGTSAITGGAYKLYVENGIRTKKVKVDQGTSWPDYVFHQQYKLPSLKEIEEFIQKNQHLPDVPSAKEVEENGLDLGDNQAILLKKIEELTLHLISINKQVEKLTEENEALKKKVDKRERNPKK